MSFELGFLTGGEEDTVPARVRLAAFSRRRVTSDVLPDEVLARVEELKEARQAVPDRLRERTHGTLLPDESRLLLAGAEPTGRIYGVPCEKGWVCWFVSGRSGAMCAARLKDGLAVGFDRHGQELVVHGLVPHGTSSVSVRAADGEHPAEVGESGFLAVLRQVGTGELRELLIADCAGGTRAVSLSSA